MFSLAYTQAYDPYHTVFRFLVLLYSSEEKQLNYRIIRTSDFFLCFPWLLKDLRPPRNIKGFAKARNKILRDYPKNRYDNLPSARVVFERMELIQATAVSALAGANMIDEAAVSSGKLVLKSDSVPLELAASVQTSTKRMADLVHFLSVVVAKMEERGRDGIFARSGLGEHSYDVI